VLQPVLQAAVFTLLFSRLASTSLGVPYVLFALAGLVLWNLFAKIVNEGAASLVTNQHIITKLFFPRIYLVLASGASALVDLAISALLVVALMAWYGVSPSLALPLAAAALAGIIVLSFGAATLLAAINARWRDVQHTLPLLLQIGILVTPVGYRSDVVPPEYRWVLAVNPLTGWLELFRGAVLGLPMPDARTIGFSATATVAIALFGVWYFRRAESTIVDVV
ncbi:MAG: ABC transporter permease, partial [Gemmatimonadota bacterium]|nr:ABC transporter permease [Gemmatimonadota bacterium]